MSSYMPWHKEGKFPWGHEEFWAMSWRDADKLCKWFVESMPDRLSALLGFVRDTPGFESWQADYSRESLVPLEHWLIKVLETRPTAGKKTKPTTITEEMKGEAVPIVRHVQLGTERGEWEYVDEPLARSVVVDVGTYLGECLHYLAPLSIWVRCKDKRNVMHNQPGLQLPQHALTGPDLFPFTTGPICVADALERKKSEDNLADCYDAYLPKVTYQKPPPPRIIHKRKGEPLKTPCIKCGFLLGHVQVPQGNYCNHCGHLDASAMA